LNAASALSDDARYVFLIIGGGSNTESLRQGVAVRKLNSFRFLPYQPRETLEDSLAAADVHFVSLLPALEGLIVPSKLYGILAAGRALIFLGDRDGEIARVIRRADCGSVVEVGDAGALVQTLRSMSADPEKLSRSGMRARNLLCEEYSLQHALGRWIALLDATG
jgi:glycosyltransferase involved in cell wall biosynthesis